MNPLSYLILLRVFGTIWKAAWALATLWYGTCIPSHWPVARSQMGWWTLQQSSWCWWNKYSNTTGQPHLFLHMYNQHPVCMGATTQFAWGTMREATFQQPVKHCIVVTWGVWLLQYKYTVNCEKVNVVVSCNAYSLYLIVMQFVWLPMQSSLC